MQTCKIVQLLNEIKEEDLAPLYLYTFKKQTVFVYRLIYFFFGTLFLFLSLIIYQASPSFLSHHFFDMGHVIQNSVTILSLLLGIISIVFAMHLKCEKDVLCHMIHMTKIKMRSIYSSKRRTVGLLQFFLFTKASNELLKLKRAKLAFLEEMEHQKMTTVHVLEKIRLASNMTKEKKEELQRKALKTLDEKLKEMLHEIETQLEIKLSMKGHLKSQIAMKNTLLISE